MKKRIIMFSFIFWWSIMFPVLNFTDNELVQIEQENVQFKSLFIEILH